VGFELALAAVVQTIIPARYPCPRARAVARFRGGVLRTLRRTAVAGREVAVRARAARPWWLRHGQRLDERGGRDQRRGGCGDHLHHGLWLCRAAASLKRREIGRNLLLGTLLGP
jgi:hypothetical protein